VLLASAQHHAGAERRWEVQLEERTHRHEAPGAGAGIECSRAVLSWQ
jgi:hypothetical protein